MVMRQPSKLVTRVRFPSPALRACSSMAEQRPHTPVCPPGEILVVQVVKFGGTWTNDRVVIPSQA